MKLIDAWNGVSPFEPASRLLRRVLLCNAISSAALGLLLIVAGGLVSALMGVPEAALLLRLLGAGLVLFGFGVEWVATRAPMNTAHAWAVITLDIAWIIGSIVLLPFIASELTLLGEAAIILVAAVVLVWAAGQITGVRRLAPRSASSVYSR